MAQLCENGWRYDYFPVKLLQDGFLTHQNEIMKRRRVRDNNSHKLSPYVLSKFRSVVIQKDPALPKECFPGPVVEPQQFKRAATRNDTRRVCANDKPLQNAACPALRVARQELRNRLRYFHVHNVILN